MITGVVGWPGAGKTYTAVKLALEQFRAAAKRQEYLQVYANMSGFRCPEAIYYDGLADFASVTNGLVVMDEAGVFLSSRYWQSVPRELLMSLAQVRKNGLDLIWVTQHEARVDTVLRELTSNIIRCRAVGGWTIAQTEDAASKTQIGRRVYRRSKTVFDQFDTFEIIGTHGGSEGRGAGALSLAARRREAASTAKRKASRHERRVRLFRWYLNEARLTREAFEAAEYLTDNDVCLDALPDWQEVVRAEVQRRRWLAVWGLEPDDAPLNCTYESPWLLNHSPRDARIRADALRSIEEIKERSKKRK